jgi:hypothetical protein
MGKKKERKIVLFFLQEASGPSQWAKKLHFAHPHGILTFDSRLL